MLPTITDTAINQLNESAGLIQSALAKEGEHYAIEDLNGILSRWLELSIESLCEDALFHCITGDRTFAINQPAFEKLLKTIPCQEANVAA